MKILITGAGSFTGKTLLPMLEEAGHEIFSLVRRDQDVPSQFMWNFTDDLPANLPKCYAVVHLAAFVDFQNKLDPLQYRVNTISTAKLVAYACKNRAYLVFASMVGVHGLMPKEYNDESPINPENNYAMSKYLAEEIVRTFAGNYSILRIGGIYGLDGPGHLGLNTAITNAYYNKVRPTIKGSGKAKRNYICVYDVARWILYLIKRCEGYGTDMQSRETLYLAGPEVMTIENYLTDIADVLLSDKDVCRADGAERSDMIIKYTPFPFAPVMFRQYLQSLKHNSSSI